MPRPPQANLGVDTVLGCVDVGQKAYWWDYGRLELYMQNNLHITEENASANALRTFMKLGDARQVRRRPSARELKAASRGAAPREQAGGRE